MTTGIKDTERMAMVGYFNTNGKPEQNIEDALSIIRLAIYKDFSLTANVLRQLGNIGATIVENYKDSQTAKQNAIHQALCYIYQFTKAPKRLTAERRVVYLVDPLQQYFYRGDAEGSSEATKQLFEKFVDDLEQCPELIDSSWAINFQHNDWFKLCLQKRQEKKQ